MNANLLRPLPATLLLACCALAAVSSLRAEDRYRTGGQPRIVQISYRSIYPASAGVAASPAPVTAAAQPAVTPEKRPLQRLEIPIGFSGQRSTAPTGGSNVVYTGSQILPEAQVKAPVDPNATLAPAPAPPKETVKRLPELDVSKLPFATLSNKRGFVKSPYEPFNELDATGLSSGMLAKDPTTGKIFRVP